MANPDSPRPGYLPQPGYVPPSQNQPGYQQAPYGQQPGIPQPGYAQPGYPQGYSQPGYPVGRISDRSPAHAMHAVRVPDRLRTDRHTHRTLRLDRIFYVGYGTERRHPGSARLIGRRHPLFIGSVIMLAGFGWTIYNRWITAGRTGQSLGKRVIKITLIGEATGQPIGALNAFLRDLVHILDASPTSDISGPCGMRSGRPSATRS